jgi:hypothetical protein
MTDLHTLSDRNDIRTHIQIVADLQTPVTIESGGFKLSDCRLIYTHANGERLFVCIPSWQSPENGVLHFAYTLHEVPYQFSSKIEGRADAHGNMTLVPTRLPKTIQSFNRRLFNRTKFSPNDPMGFFIQIDKGKAIHVFAEDISAGGIGFLVPESLNLFSLGNQYSIKIYIPEFGQIRAQVNVRNLRKLIGMLRIGVKFTSLDVKYRMKIIEIVTRAMSNTTSYIENSGDADKKRILLDDHGAKFPLWPFLEKSYNVLRRSLIANHLDREAFLSDLIILNLDSGSPTKTLKYVRKSSQLRLPLILTSKRYATLPSDMPEVRFARSSITPNELTTTIDRLIYEYRWSQKISQTDIDNAPMTRILLLNHSQVLPENILDALTGHFFNLDIINDDQNLINRSVDIDPDVVLVVHSDNPDNRARTMMTLKILNLNKFLKPKPKILLTSDQTLADDSKSQNLVIQTVSLPVLAPTLLQAITSVTQ